MPIRQRLQLTAVRPMLVQARKTPLLDALYARYGRRLLRKAFARVSVGGAAWPAGDGPTVAYLNHSAWWDPILALFLARDVFGRDGYGLMQGEQLRRYPFFRHVGGFGVTGRSLDDARALAQYMERTLRGGARRSVWIFPQGELLPARAPLAFRSGLARLGHAVPEARLVPIAVRYELRGEQRPECVVRVGEPVGVDRPGAPGSIAVLTRRLEHRLRAELAALDADMAADDLASYAEVLRGRGSLSALYSRTLGRIARADRRTPTA